MPGRVGGVVGLVFWCFCMVLCVSLFRYSIGAEWVSWVMHDGGFMNIDCYRRRRRALEPIDDPLILLAKGRSTPRPIPGRAGVVL